MNTYLRKKEQKLILKKTFFGKTIENMRKKEMLNLLQQKEEGII